MGTLADLRVLVVEDEFLIAAVLCDMLEDACAVVVGHASTVQEAMQMVQDRPIDAAILDMNLGGHWSDPVAEELQRRGIPFVFTTGYGPNEGTSKFRARVVSKPYAWEEVEIQLGLAIADAEVGNG